MMVATRYQSVCVLVGRKKGNQLIVDGKRFTL